MWGGGGKPRKEWEERGVDSGFPVYESAIDVETEELVGGWIESHDY